MAIIPLDITQYPNIDTTDIGSLPNAGYGSPKNVRCHSVVGGATTRSTEDITDSVETITADDISRFPPAPFTVQIESERMLVVSISDNIMNVTRGYDSTLAVTHKKRETIFEVITEYVYLIANRPIKAVNNVYIDALKQNDARITAYTGQNGDEHSGWPGVATLAFTAESYVAPQYNTENANQMQSGEAKNGTMDLSSYGCQCDLVPVLEEIGQDNKTVAWRTFKLDSGFILKQTYNVTLENASETDDAICLLSVNYQTIGKAILPITVPHNSGTKTYTFEREGGEWDDTLVAVCGAGNVIISNMSKVVIIRREKYDIDINYATTNPPHEIEHLDEARINFVSYPFDPPVSLGVTEIISETHIANITVGAGESCKIRLVGTDPVTSNAFGFDTFEIPSPGNYTLTVKYDGGNWGSVSKLILLHGDVPTINSLTKTIEYATDITEGYDSQQETSSARIIVGNRISVDADWAVDITGDYGGIGSLIERPDWVIKHFLVTQKGAVLADIDNTSFAAAGALYASAISGGYKLAFIWDLSFDEDRMAEESRSVIYMTAGKYYLDFIPDTAPAAVMTINESDVIGEDPPFDHGKIEELFTDYTAKFGMKQDGGWTGVVTSIDAENKHGPRKQQVTLGLIRLELMAQDVLDNILLQHQALYKTVTLVVSWKYQELQIGDTFDIVSSLHNGKKFFIESLTINEDKTITIVGKEWW